MKQGKWPKGVEKNVNPLIYFLWSHSAQEWKAWVPGFTSGMWSSVWRNEQERIEFMKCIGQDLLNNKITDQMEQILCHVLQANLPEKLWHIFELQLAEWTTTRPPWKAYEAAVRACACLFMKLSQLGRIPQNFAGFHYQAQAYVQMKLRRKFNARQGD
uniref:Uncharacterized protein n=1 Tax=Romanomermis culicivorax TaxID=13658 RepID=A0A915LA86_ROMCU